MNRESMNRCRAMVFVLAAAGALLGCHEAAETPAGPGGLLAAAGGGVKPTSEPSVTAADPAYGHQGDVEKRVTITGSGFSPGAQAAWERGGVVDSKVQVLSTDYVSSTQLVATITIATDADIDLYDISVTALDRKKGIGYALFEVTQAIVVPGTYPLRASNDAGDMTGGGPGTISFNPTSGLVELLDPSGEGWAVDQTGTAIVGGAVPRLWNRVGGVWQVSLLPTNPSGNAGRASSLSADASGQVLLIGGLEIVPTGKRSTTQQPRLWIWRAATSNWERIVLPTGTTTKGDVLGVSDNGVAAGWITGTIVQAAVWESNGSGYSLTTLASVTSRAMGINGAGTLIVGTYDGVAAYWERLPGGGWSAPTTLPGNCTLARDVDDSGRIAANSCPDGNRSSPAVFVPPYSTATMIRLGGLGPTNSGFVEGMSPSGNYIVGQANQPGGSIGVYWKMF